jgi:diguanylate cyclase (GGDEF)-like protein
MRPPRILCIGSAHLDILSSVTGDTTALDRIGRTTLEVGGTACNVAINLARLGASTTLLTALDNSALADIVVRHIDDSGVELRLKRGTAGDPLIASFCAHLDSAGELISAVSSMPVENTRFSVEKTKGRWDAVFIDANLHPLEIKRLAERFSKTLVFLAAVSEEKSQRLLPALPSITAFFCNEREMNYLEKKSGLSPQKMSEDFCTVFNTRGENGADVWVGGERINVPAVRRPRGGNRLGAGDALAAATIFHICQGSTPAEAIKKSMPYAIEVAESINTNVGKAAPIERAIMSYRKQAFVDTLTGMPNRPAGIRHGDEIRKHKNNPICAVAILDVDKFKLINDELGHDVGDLALKSVAQAVMSALRKGDFACRWGGEEFCCFIDARVASEAVKAAERIRKAVEDILGNPRPITASLGVALWRQHETLDEALQRADKALYAAKHAGRNRVEINAENTRAV